MDHIPIKNAWSGIADCRNCTLRKTVLFAGLTEGDFSAIHTPIAQNIFPPGEALFRLGQTADTLMTIRKGLVKLATLLPDGTQRIVRLLRPGDVAGLDALVGGEYRYDAIALTPTEVCRLPSELVRDLAKTNPAMHEELMRRWHHALSEADIWLSEFSTGSARQRVARLLLRLAGKEDGVNVTLFGREDLGAILGVTTETASRTIAEFKRRGLIEERAANRFRCNIERLTELLDSL